MTLFADEGFDEVTISQVADAAGVSKMTVTNYFRRKEDLVFDRAEATIRSLAHAVSARAPGESLLKAIRRDCAARIAAGDVTLGPPSATFARIVQNSRVLTSRSLEIADLRERALGDAIAAETGVDDLQQRVVAASSPLSIGCCSPRAPDACWPASRVTRSSKCWQPPPPGLLIFWSRRWGATASGPTRCASWCSSSSGRGSGCAVTRLNSSPLRMLATANCGRRSQALPPARRLKHPHGPGARSAFLFASSRWRW
jgi:AcrR family transcriptional regulator